MASDSLNELEDVYLLLPGIESHGLGGGEAGAGAQVKAEDEPFRAGSEQD